MEERYFITVEWYDNGERGIFCNRKGQPFPKDKEPHTEEEMRNVLNVFSLILSPKSEKFNEKQLKEFTRFRPLEEYNNKFGIVLKKEGQCQKKD